VPPKNDKPKPSSSPLPTDDPWATLFGLIIGAAILGALFMRIREIGESIAEGRWLLATRAGQFFSETLLPIAKVISFAISALSIVGIAIIVVALTKINRAQNEIYDPAPIKIGETYEDPKKNPRWDRVLSHLNSENPNDWKFAILEADIILDELLNFMGYRGETLSDKLKRVERGDFDTIDSAWEAHKVRNQIAHEGADFVVTEREARRVIELYRKVFEEFHFV